MPSPEREDLQRLATAYERLLTDEHSSRWSLDNPGNQAGLAERLRIFSELTAHRLPSRRLQVLDLGCGSLSLVDSSLNVEITIGVDLLFSRLTDLRAAGSQTPTVNANGATLPFPANTFDVVVLSTMMSSVLDSQVRHSVGREVERVLRGGGALLWYDFRFPNPRNRATRAVGHRELRKLFPSLIGEIKSLTVLPPLARRVGRLLPRAYPLLARLPFVRSHLAACLVKPTQ